MCREAKIMLGISALFTLAMGLSGIFVNVFFWRQTNSFNVIIIYNLLNYIATPFAFYLAGVLAKRKNGAWSLRIGLLLFALFYALILFIGSRGNLYIYLLGVLHGIAAGFYWLAFNTLCFDFTCVTNRDTFNGCNGGICGVAAAVSPITSGYIISRYGGITGYNIVFTAALVLFVVIIMISMLIKCKNYGSRINVKAVFSRNCRDWEIIRKATFVWGLRDCIIVFLVNILIIETTGSEFSLGEFSLIAALLSSISFMVVPRLIKPPKRIFSIFFGAAFSVISVIGLAYKVTYATLLLYTILDAIFIPFFIIQVSSSTFNVISRAHDEDLRIEYLINKDIVINSGRSVSAIILLLLLINFKDSNIIRIFLLFMGVTPLISGFLLSKLKIVLEGRVK